MPPGSRFPQSSALRRNMGYSVVGMKRAQKYGMHLNMVVLTSLTKTAAVRACGSGSHSGRALKLCARDGLQLAVTMR